MNRLLYVFIIAFGLFSIINTEFGVIGTFIQITEKYHISASQAGMLVRLFALTIAIFGPFMTLLFTRCNRKKIMAFVLALFAFTNLVSAAALASEARKAPEFANSLFVSFSNLGIAVGTASGGQFLLHMGTHQIIWGGLLFLALAVIGIFAKIKVFGPTFVS